MAAWTLSDRQWDALDEARFATTNASVFRNATIILMSGVGRSKFEIAHDLGCSPATVDNVRKRYRDRGLSGLQPRKPPGRTSAATTEFRQLLRQVVQTPPASFGYGFSVWSTVRLAEHMKKQTGLAFSEDQLRRILHQEGFSMQRPKHTMKGKRNEVAYAKASKELRTLKKKPCATTPISS
jgi:transposase